nr:MAG TPA: hypothetical protein [Caudoviricetes sp.]
MSKAVLISIRHKWVEKIVNGEKTIEVRKTRPKLQTPFKCYIYCTMDHPYISVSCGEQDKLNYRTNTVCRCNGKVIGEFTCERIVPITYDGGRLWCPTNAAFSPATCLSQAEIIAYIGDRGRCYGWHISDLLIYDQPRELSEFQRATDPCDSCHAEYTWKCTDCKKLGGDIKRPPQSWCYVEEG